MQKAAVSLFESSLGQRRSNKDLEGPDCSNYCYSCERCVSLMNYCCYRNYVVIAVIGTMLAYEARYIHVELYISPST